jgi:LPS export ABC transporter permease LptG
MEVSRGAGQLRGAAVAWPHLSLGKGRSRPFNPAPRSMKLLDRYVLRNFVEPFLICFFGFVAIWLIIDLSDNGSDFIEAHASFKQLTYYYLTQLPQTVLISMPIGLLLALLFSLSRMSRTNELISMLTAGRSVVRILIPLLVIGVMASAFCLWLNWDQAPHAEGVKKLALNQIKRGRRIGEAELVAAHLFRDRQNNRTWYVRRLRPGSPKLEDVHITQQDVEGRITKKWYAQRATFDPRGKTWTLSRGMTVEFTPEGDIADTDHFPTSNRTIKDWSETPWRVASSELNPQGLSIPELREYLLFNSDFPDVQLAPYRANLADRWALPVSCLVVVFIAAPLGIVYNRRGVVGGVAAAIFIFFLMIIARGFFMAVAKGNRLDPMLAPWVPNVVLGIVGLVLLWFRSTNRDLPSLFARRK